MSESARRCATVRVTAAEQEQVTDVGMAQVLDADREAAADAEPKEAGATVPVHITDKYFFYQIFPSPQIYDKMSSDYIV